MPFQPAFDRFFRAVVAVAFDDYEVVRADSRLDERGILEKIMGGVDDASVILADLTGTNANVMYELGIAHTLGKPTIMITQCVRDLPFDVRAYPVHEYAPDGTSDSQLLEQLRQLANGYRLGTVRFANPVTDFIPRLEEIRNPSPQIAYSIGECTSDLNWAATEISRFFDAFDTLANVHMAELAIATPGIGREARRGVAPSHNAALATIADLLRRFASELSQLTSNFHAIWERFGRAMLWVLEPGQREHLPEGPQHFGSMAERTEEHLNVILRNLAELRHASDSIPRLSGDIGHALDVNREALTSLLNEIMTAKAYLSRIRKAAATAASA